MVNIKIYTYYIHGSWCLRMKGKPVDMTEQTARKWLHDRGVTVTDIGELVLYLQHQYHENLLLDECIKNVERVLSKREVQNAILTGIQLANDVNIAFLIVDL